jgi:uncharacterized protein DUF4386
MTDGSFSPDKTARLAGALYLAVVVLSIYALASIGGIIEANDPISTSSNLLRVAPEFRLAVVANLVATLCYIGVVGLLNELLRPAGPGISRIAVLFGVAGCVIGASAAILQLTAPAGLSPQTMTVMAPTVHMLLLSAGRANSVGLTLFGVYCLLLGWLVFRSGFIPRLFGILLILSGVTWLIGNMALLAEPRLAGQFLLIVGVAALGEILFTLWLLLKGVDVDRWQAAAREQRTRETATAGS